MTATDPVDRLISAAAATAERELTHAVRPPFAAVVARAHRLAPADVPARWLADATHPRTPDVATSARTTAARPTDAATSARTADARLVDVVTSSHAAAAPHATRTRALVARRWIVPLLAAAVLLAFAVQRRLATRAAADERAFQAGAQPDSAPPQPIPPPHATVPAQPLPETTTPSPDPTPPPRAATRPPAPPREREPLDALLARLDDEAEACMQLGDLACAEARYQEIVQRGGRRVQVELAFADRFHLARRRDDTPALRKLWTAYLARFPRGQFADDARGGLCRHDPDPPACWRAYLVDFPSGSFAAEAGGAAR